MSAIEVPDTRITQIKARLNLAEQVIVVRQ